MPRCEVFHQDAAINRLRRALGSTRVPHAYLFTGPAGVGKEMLARQLAQRLLCEAFEGAENGPGLFGTVAEPLDPSKIEPCGTCADCVLFESGNHPDFHRIHRALNKMHPDKAVQRRKAIDLGVDVIRHFLLDPIGLRPSRGRAKVFVIVDGDRLTPQAQNALLKTLEEPPGVSYLILLAAAPDQLLQTTRSRCQQISFSPLPDLFVMSQLKSRQVADADAAFLTQLAQGSLGAALRLTESRVHERIGEVTAAIMMSREDPLAAGKSLADLAKEMSIDGKTRADDEDADSSAIREAQELVIAMTATLVREIQRALVGAGAPAIAGEPRLSGLCAGATTRSLGRTIRALSMAEYQLDQNANATLAFDAVGIALGEIWAGQPRTAAALA